MFCSPFPGGGVPTTSLRLGITASYTFEEDPVSGSPGESKGGGNGPATPTTTPTVTSELSFTCPADLKYAAASSIRGGGGVQLFHHHHPMSCAYSGCSCSVVGGRGVGSQCSFNGDCAGEDALMAAEETAHHHHPLLPPPHHHLQQQHSPSDKVPGSSSSSGGGSCGGGTEDCGSPPECSGCHGEGDDENGGGDGSINCCSGNGNPTAGLTSTIKATSALLTPSADDNGSPGPPSPSGSIITSSSNGTCVTASAPGKMTMGKMSCEQQQQQDSSNNNNNVRTKPVLKFSVSAILGADDHHHRMKRVVSESTPVFNASKDKSCLLF